MVTTATCWNGVPWRSTDAVDLVDLGYVARLEETYAFVLHRGIGRRLIRVQSGALRERVCVYSHDRVRKWGLRPTRWFGKRRLHPRLGDAPSRDGRKCRRALSRRAFRRGHRRPFPPLPQQLCSRLWRLNFGACVV